VSACDVTPPGHRWAEKRAWPEWDYRHRDAVRLGWPPPRERFDVALVPCPGCGRVGEHP
jgi:hypothetical protein